MKNWTGLSVCSEVQRPAFISDIRLSKNSGFLPIGNARSYGKIVCAKDSHVEGISTLLCEKILSFDRANGVITVESGATLKSVLQFVLPFGWTVPVMPGTSFATVGGMIANNVHGKNHHISGSFVHCVKSVEVLNTRARVVASYGEPLFWATVGGWGATGLITQATIQLTRFDPIESYCFSINSIEEFLVFASDKSFEHSVAWVDVFSSTFSGVFFGAKEIAVSPTERLEAGMRAAEGLKNSGSRRLPKLPLINKFTARSLSIAYKRTQPIGEVDVDVDFKKFHFPLDGFVNWVNAYGKRGFYQVQWVIPDDAMIISLVIELLKTYASPSFVCVLKKIDVSEQESHPYGLFFPRKGISIAMDFIGKEPEFKKLYEEMLFFCKTQNIEPSFYPAKLPFMEPSEFVSTFGLEALENWMRHVDPKFLSNPLTAALFNYLEKK